MKTTRFIRTITGAKGKSILDFGFSICDLKSKIKNQKSKIHTLYALCFMLSIAISATSQGATIVLQNGVEGYNGTEDAYIRGGYQSDQPHNGNNLIIRGYMAHRTYIRFDLSSIVDKAITTAKLSLYRTSSTDEPDVVRIYRVDPDWHEDTLTRDDAPSFGEEILSKDIGMDKDVWVDFDLTQEVSDRIRDNVTLSIEMVTALTGRWNVPYTTFHSSEYSDVSLRPKLTITYIEGAPFAHAGDDQSVDWGAAVTLDATGSYGATDTQKDLTYSWHFLSKPWDSRLVDDAIQPNNDKGYNGADTPTLIPDAAGVYLIELTVTNSSGLNSKDTVEISYIRSHPRIWLTPELLSTLTDRMNKNTPEWQYLVRSLDRNLVHGNALIYQLTKDPKYAEAAYKAIEPYLTYEIRDNSYGSGAGPDAGYITAYNIRGVGPSTAIVFDWCYDWLNEPQKSEMISRFNEWGDFTKNERLMGNYPASDYFYGYLLAEAFMGLASYGDNPRAEEFITHARDRFELEFLHYIAKYGEKGDWLQGGYSAGMKVRIAQYMEAVKTAVGEDLFSYTDFLEETMYNQIYISEPNLRYVHTYDHWGRDITGSIWDSDRAAMLIPMKTYAHRDSAQYIQWWIRRTQPSYRYFHMSNFMWYDPDIPEKDPSDLPLSYFSPGTGHVIARSDWTEDATSISFRNAPHITHLQGWDAGHFLIYRKAKLAVDVQTLSHGAGYTDASWGHNTILINDLGQEKGLGAAPGSTRYEDGGDYVYMEGDVTQAYTGRPASGKPRILDLFTRQIVFLRPDYFVIFDRVRTPNANDTKKWLIHTRNEPQITGNGAIATNGTGRLFTVTLLPTSATIHKIDESTVKAGLNSWRIEIQPADMQADTLFLHVLYVSDVSTSTMPLTSQIDAGTMVGVQVADRTVLFSKTGSSVDEVQYTINGSGLVRTMICDMIPNTIHTVLKDGSSVQTAEASENGVLTFDLTLDGEHRIAVNSPGTPPLGRPGTPQHVED